MKSQITEANEKITGLENQIKIKEEEILNQNLQISQKNDQLIDMKSEIKEANEKISEKSLLDKKLREMIPTMLNLQKDIEASNEKISLQNSQIILQEKQLTNQQLLLDDKSKQITNLKAEISNHTQINKVTPELVLSWCKKSDHYYKDYYHLSQYKDPQTILDFFKPDFLLDPSTYDPYRFMLSIYGMQGNKKDLKDLQSMKCKHMVILNTYYKIANNIIERDSKGYDTISKDKIESNLNNLEMKYHKEFCNALKLDGIFGDDYNPDHEITDVS